MDFFEIERKYEGTGHPAYHPKIMLKLLIMGTIDGLRSSRKIARAARENVVYMFLAGNLKPDFRTISDFRKNNPEIVSEVFKKVVKYARKFRMVKLGHISLVGKIGLTHQMRNFLIRMKLNCLKKLLKKLKKEFRKESDWMRRKMGERR